MKVDELRLGLPVEINALNEYWTEYIGTIMYITALSLNSDGVGINITLGQTLNEHESDGWLAQDLDLFLPEETINKLKEEVK